MNHTFRIVLLLSAVALVAAQVSVTFAATNVPPTPVVIQAMQRPGTTFMDIDYRVNDPDDATVQTAALGFVNGGTGLSNVLKLNTLVEGTAVNIGSNTPANTPLRLTWNVAADWNTNFGNVQVEILAKDGRGLLPFHWITLPSNGPNPEVTIDAQPVYDADLLPVWYWLIATGDPTVHLVNGQVLGVGGNYTSNLLAQGTSTTGVGRAFLWERFDFRSLSSAELTRAKTGRYGFQSLDAYSIAKGFLTSDRVYGWGYNNAGQLNVVSVPVGKIAAVALGGHHTLVLAGGGVTGWGANDVGQTTIPASATNMMTIAAGHEYSLALRADGTVVGWGWNVDGEATVPANATNVTAIAAGYIHSLALRSDGTVVGWGANGVGETTIPTSATNVMAIAAGCAFSLALLTNGTVVGWGYNNYGQTSIPASATNVRAIAAGIFHALALRGDGTVVAWGAGRPGTSGYDHYGQSTVPASATNVVAIAAGAYHSLALKADGTVVGWGRNNYGQLNVPAGALGIDLLGIGCTADHVVVVDKRTP